MKTAIVGECREQSARSIELLARVAWTDAATVRERASCFDLLRSESFKMIDGRLAARELRSELEGLRVVLLGSRVARCFNVTPPQDAPALFLWRFGVKLYGRATESVAVVTSRADSVWYGEAAEQASAFVRSALGMKVEQERQRKIL